MNQSENINELAKALATAQGDFPILEKKSQGYNYKYADLAEVLGAIQKPLQANELAVVCQKLDGAIMVKLLHSSGQWISTYLPVVFKEDGKTNAMQAMGSAITYARRYAICCLLNLAADDESDDDGEKSSPKEGNTPKSSVPTTIQPGQVANLQSWLNKYPEEKEKVFKSCAIERLEDMAWKDFPRTLDYFKKLESKRSGS